MERAGSVSTGSFSDELRKAVGQALAKGKLGSTAVDVQLLPHGVVGFVLNDKDVGEHSTSSLTGLARDVAGHVPGLASASDATVILKGGHVIIGFVPSQGVKLG